MLIFDKQKEELQRLVEAKMQEGMVFVIDGEQCNDEEIVCKACEDINYMGEMISNESGMWIETHFNWVSRR